MDFPKKKRKKDFRKNPHLAVVVVHLLCRLQIPGGLVDLQLGEELPDGGLAHPVQLLPVHGEEEIGATVLALHLLYRHEAVAGLKHHVKEDEPWVG